jgi:cytochrome c-type biogenesis protein CcmH/NrfF
MTMKDRTRQPRAPADLRGESVMLRTVCITVTTVLMGSIVPALAAVEGYDPPNNYATWVFLGFCALIIVAQLATLARRGPRQRSRELDQAAEHSKAH